MTAGSTISNADAVVLIYSTAPDEGTAARIAEALLEARLIACANIMPGMTSVYRWRGTLARDNEVAMIMKTRASLAAQAIDAARQLHPYETPAFVTLPIAGGHNAFLDWVRFETG